MKADDYDTFVILDGKKRDDKKVMEVLDELDEQFLKGSYEASPHMTVRELAQKIAEKRGSDADDKIMLELFLSTCVDQEWARAQEKLSALKYQSSDGLYGDDWLIPKGFISVMEKAAEKLDICLSCPVSQIDQTSGQGVIIKCADGNTMAADYVICTLPLGVLQANTVQFLPPLSEKKSEAIKKLGSGTLDKLILVFDQVFWPNKQVFYLGNSKTNEYSFGVNLNRINKVPALMLYISETEVTKYGNEAAILQFGLRLVKESFPNAQVNLLNHKTTNWGGDPFSRGSYCSFPVGSGMSDVIATGTPEGRNFFAGEHTYKSDMGTVNGAWCSGLATSAPARRA